MFNETLCLYMFSGSRLETQPLLLQRTRFYTRYVYAYKKKNPGETTPTPGKISGVFTKKFRSQNNPELEERVLVFLLDPVPKMALRKLFQDSFIPFRERLIEDYERKAIPISFHGDYVGTHRVQNTSDMKQTRCFRPR